MSPQSKEAAGMRSVASDAKGVKSARVADPPGGSDVGVEQSNGSQMR